MHSESEHKIPVYREKTNDEMNVDILSASNRMTRDTVLKTEDLVARSKEARDAMEELTATFKKSWIEFQQTCDERLKELRQMRMGTDVEMKHLISSLRDVRQFFMEKDYAQEIARLKEFVDVCERLQKLKDSGFVDKVAETMLRLAE